MKCSSVDCSTGCDIPAVCSFSGGFFDFAPEFQAGDADGSVAFALNLKYSCLPERKTMKTTMKSILALAFIMLTLATVHAGNSELDTDSPWPIDEEPTTIDDPTPTTTYPECPTDDEPAEPECPTDEDEESYGMDSGNADDALCLMWALMELGLSDEEAYVLTVLSMDESAEASIAIPGFVTGKGRSGGVRRPTKVERPVFGPHIVTFAGLE